MSTNETTSVDKVRKVELLISNLLRIGVTLSLLVVAVGTVISFTRHRDYVSAPSDLARLTRPGAVFPHSVSSIANELLQLRGRAVVMAGLILLIATPVARVAVSILAFIYQKDRTFVLLTTVVLILLILSFFLGTAG